jgi:hypothetical protein
MANASMTWENPAADQSRDGFPKTDQGGILLAGRQERAGNSVIE